MEDIYGDFWAAFLEESGTPTTTVLENYMYFGDSESSSVAAVEQMLRGEKTAVSRCISYFLTTNQRIPQTGDYTLVTDFYGNPCCIFRTLAVTIAPMPEISDALRIQDAPERSPAEWLTLRQQEYRDLAQRFGFHYHDELLVLMETVELVYPVKS